MKLLFRYILIGCLAGTVTGVLGAGGGMILIPLLSLFCKESSEHIFAISLSIMLPICIVSLFFIQSFPNFRTVLPYLVGSISGGIIASLNAKKIRLSILHKAFGIISLLGAIRCFK